MAELVSPLLSPEGMVALIFGLGGGAGSVCRSLRIGILVCLEIFCWLFLYLNILIIFAKVKVGVLSVRVEAGH